LPCSPDLRADLHRLGLVRVGDVARQELNAMIDRFGCEGQRVWELANGIDDRPLQPRCCEELIQETISLPAAGVSLPLLYIAVDRLLQRAYARPSMQGRYSWSALLSCALDRAATWEQTCHF